MRVRAPLPQTVGSIAAIRRRNRECVAGIFRHLIPYQRQYRRSRFYGQAGPDFGHVLQL